METSAPNTPPVDFDVRPALARPLTSVLFPLLFLIAASVLIRWMNLDLIVARSFWSGNWQLRNYSLVEFLYDFGSWPALLAGFTGLGVWILSFSVVGLRRVRRFALFLFLCLVLGPGLLVNVVLKDNFGRPRPREIVEFGGHKEFRAVGQKPFIGEGKSFPSGHTAMGYFWLGPCIYFWRRHRKLACGLAVLALIQGGLMGFGRIAQGGHWLSDILWSAGFVYLTAWLVWRLLTRVNHPLVTDKTPQLPSTPLS